MSLARYKAKRDFRRTREPAGRKRAAKPHHTPKFVVQKHAATRLHYDFRLELDGVLKSWAVPKGFPVVKGEKRLAMQVEDHPIEYGGFEGTIPPGNYGTGTVMLWDFGDYEILESKPLEALKKGKLSLELRGKKLKGRWHLVRMRGGDGAEDGEKSPWLMIKADADMKPISARADDKSVLSGKTMKQIAAADGKVWESDSKKKR